MTSHTASLGNVRSSAAKTLRQLLDFIKRNRNPILLIVSIVLILLAVYLVYQLVTQAFKHEFSCKHLIDESVFADKFSMCAGVNFQIPQYDIDVWPIPRFSIGPFPSSPFTVLPDLNPINGPLEAARKFVAWNIILVFIVISLVLAFIVIKIKAFVGLFLTPEGRKTVLINFSLWLLFFAIFCTLFYIRVVAGP